MMKRVRIRSPSELLHFLGVAPKEACPLSSTSAGVWKEFTMPQAKQTSKQKRRGKALPVLGAAGLSLSLASVASAVPSGLGDMPTPKTGDDNRVTLGAEDVSFAPFYLFDKESEGKGVSLGEEEVSDVSLATFYVFDRPRWYNLSATAAADVTVAADATVAAAVEVAITLAADATVAAAVEVVAASA